jgi:hypothetical protein
MVKHEAAFSGSNNALG